MARSVSRGAIFNQNVAQNVPHTKFDLSFVNKLSCKFGYLTPIYCKRVVPGDYFSFTDQVLLKTLPLITPAYVDIDIDVRYFYVPCRLVWDKFNDFIVNPDQDTLIPPVVRYTCSAASNGSVFDYLGYPTGLPIDFNRDLSSYRLRMYNLIWNTWYRDQNLQDEVEVFADHGGENPDDMDDFKLLPCSWKRDYFTSCLPDAQFGRSVRGSLDVKFTPNDGRYGKIVNPDGSRYDAIDSATTVLRTANFSGLLPPAPDLPGNMYTTSASGTTMDPNNSFQIAYDPNGTLRTSLSVSELREMTALQRFRERLMVGGHRIKEYIKSMFGVNLPDARAMYPEFLGGGSIPLTIGEVPQTSASDDVSPQGNLAGRGVSANSVSVPMYFCPEYGFIIGVMVVRPRADYFQGLDRELTQMDYYDYYNPLFEHIGEQEVMKSEIFGCTEAMDGLFGYQSRNADYKFFNNEIHGDMRDVSGLSLGSWHLGRAFSSVPSLNSDFLRCNPAIERFFAAGDDLKHDYFVVQVRHHIISSRPMSEFSTPSLIG